MFNLPGSTAQDLDVTEPTTRPSQARAGPMFVLLSGTVDEDSILDVADMCPASEPSETVDSQDCTAAQREAVEAKPPEVDGGGPASWSTLGMLCLLGAAGAVTALRTTLRNQTVE